MTGKTYNVGIYCRLSNDDERDGESVSIENQRQLLRRYVREQGWNLIDEYLEDGVTGTLSESCHIRTKISPRRADALRRENISKSRYRLL